MCYLTVRSRRCCRETHLENGINRRSALVTGGVIGVGAIAGVLGQHRKCWGVEQPASYEELMGCKFTPVDQAPLDKISVRLIPVPDFPGRAAIWGATGRDRQGHIWFGASADGIKKPSAHLFEYDPETDKVTDCGDVMTELRRDDRAKPDEGQAKIHSRIVQGEDGHLYFASMDEQGELPDGSRQPTWGGHLWRLRMPDRKWEHLKTTQEALIAVAGYGSRMHTLGYFNHIVSQYNCKTRVSRSAAVGSVGGHISRNFFCDHRGHLFVPRLKEASKGGVIRTTLVELNPDLVQVAENPLEHYTETRDENSHGLTGCQPLADKSIVFTTDQGFLYQVTPRDGKPAEVQELGWFHPKGQSYVASLFTSDGLSHLMGMALPSSETKKQYEWLVYDLKERRSRATPLTLPTLPGQALSKPLFYGSNTRDDAGNCYLGGVSFHSDRMHPLFVQVRREA